MKSTYLYFITIVLVSIVFTNALSVCHSVWVLDLALKISHFIIPSVAGLIFGMLLTMAHFLTRKVQRMNQEMNLFTGMIVHDLKTSAANIHSLTHMIQKRKTINAKHEFIQHIRSIAEDLLGTIQEILILVERQDAQSNKIELIQDNPSRDIHACIDTFEKSVKMKNLFIARDVPYRLPSVHYNGKLLKRVLHNLIGNAIKYSVDHGRIIISAKPNHEASWLQVTVQDTGQGLMEKEVKKAFNKFQTLGSVPRGGESSTGLGLWMVKKFIEEMGGQVYLSSQGLQKGCTVRFTLPLVSEALGSGQSTKIKTQPKNRHPSYNRHP